MGIIIKLTGDRGLTLERKSFVLVCFPKDNNGNPRIVPIKLIVPVKLKEGLSILKETFTPQEIWICYEGDCDAIRPKEGESLSDYIRKAFNSVEEAVESLTDSSCWTIYYIYYPLYETGEEVVWLGARYEVEEAKIQPSKGEK